MASDTKNVKLGVCRVYFDGVDLGYTQGGVEVSVKTESHKMMIDQFGKTPINEYIMGRECSAKVPLAETTLENMALVMPGATIVQTGGTVASGTFTFSTAPLSANDTITVNGCVFTCKASPTSGYEFAPGATFTASAQNFHAAAKANSDPLLADVQFTISGAVVTVKYGNELIYATGKASAAGNAITITKTGTNVAVSGAQLAGGADATAQYVSATSGVGTNLLSIAKELRFHPVDKAANDKSDDFVMPTAGTPGALTFAYKLENERVYNVDFTSYPDPVTGKLFTVGI